VKRGASFYKNLTLVSRKPSGHCVLLFGWHLCGTGVAILFSAG
jgi:hypothetical protein